ncbi:PREDICTED: uncharacterized protein LOC18587424 isoform X2 [Theobroma cacao]|uniref:Uncharacterized protein LOC18587424 isoform X2 n=1 Tax=Theobroma cacao TaxID=3641 RepID=A0AB32X049_THECC|nr:PREDICTED: uncharacterized protein LOC18587424 isoform X2 [Theobroma cacao]
MGKVEVLCFHVHHRTVVEPLLHPEGAKPGKCVSFSGIDGKPEDVLNPGRQLEKTTLGMGPQKLEGGFNAYFYNRYIFV